LARFRFADHAGTLPAPERLKGGATVARDLLEAQCVAKDDVWGALRGAGSGAATSAGARRDGMQASWKLPSKVID